MDLVNPVETTPVRAYKVCGCTDNHACFGGCYWVSVDLCSKCTEKKGETDD